MKNILNNSPLQGAFAQGRTQPDITFLFEGYTHVNFSSTGAMGDQKKEGIYCCGTGMLDFYKLKLNKSPLKHTFTSKMNARQWTSVAMDSSSMFTAGRGRIDPGIVPKGPLEVRTLRTVEKGILESLLISNHSQLSREANLHLQLRLPIAGKKKVSQKKVENFIKPEVEETPKGLKILAQRDFGVRQNQAAEELQKAMGDAAPKDGEHVVRALELQIDSQGKIEWSFEDDLLNLWLKAKLGPRESVEWNFEYSFIVDGVRFPAPKDHKQKDLEKQREYILKEETEFKSGNPTYGLILRQAQIDLHDLRRGIFDGKEGLKKPLAFAAGIPGYQGIFARDSLTTSWQSALFCPKGIDQFLDSVAIFRGVKNDAWRDEEPKKMLHERRMNPQLSLGKDNRQIYYGDIVSTMFWIVTLFANYSWTGDRKMLQDRLPVVKDNVNWLLERLKQGGGFVFYQRGSKFGNRNQGWKDSGDAIVNSKGEVEDTPLATVEVQGYAYASLLSTAGILAAVGELKEAYSMFEKAEELKKNFNRHFWMREHNFFAVALREDFSQVDSITSNVGQALTTMIVNKEKADVVVARLLSSDMYSGWGIRTLSSQNAAYNPFSYHLGSVWPPDNATISAGFRLWGHEKAATGLISDLYQLAPYYPYMRLPEAIAGHARDEQHPLPGLYPKSNLLQAWSVSAVPFTLQVLLGLRAFAPTNMLLVRPSLPEWLPSIELSNFQVGEARMRIRFWRDKKGKSKWKVLEKKGKCMVLEQDPINDPYAKMEKRAAHFFKSLYRMKS